MRKNKITSKRLLKRKQKIFTFLNKCVTQNLILLKINFTNSYYVNAKIKKI